MPGLEDLLKTFVLSPIYTIPLILIGLVLAFFGKRIFKWLIFIAGGLVVGGGLAMVATAFNQSDMIVLGAGIVGFLVGGLLAIFLLYGSLFLIGAYVGYLVAAALFPSNGVAVAVAAIVFGTLGVIIFKLTLPIFTAVAGGALVGLGLMLSGVSYSVSAIVGIVIIMLGAAYQLFHFRKR